MPSGRSAGGGDEGMPRWVRVFVAVAVLIVVLLVIVALAGGGHGPGRHLASVATAGPAGSASTAR